MTEKPITLITGVTGLLGTALIRQNERLKTIKGFHLRNYELPDTELAKCQVCNMLDRTRLFELTENDEIECIIHTAGLADVDQCEKHPDLAYASNVDGTKNIIDLAVRKRSKLVYVSTNAVFDGKTPPYSEKDEPNPINQYGKAKLECETLVKKSLENALIVRPILMYGPNHPKGRKSFLTWILENIKNGKKIHIVNDVYENPLLTDHCAEMIWKLIEIEATGIYHLAGGDVLSRYEAANMIADVYSLKGSLIHPVSSDFFSFLAPRPMRTFFNTEKVEAMTGLAPVGFVDGLLRLKDKTGISEML